MKRQNVTLSLPKEVLKQVKNLAAEKGTSVSGLLSKYLEQIVEQENLRQRASIRIEKRLSKGLNLGTKGKCSWQREELHER